MPTTTTATTTTDYYRSRTLHHIPSLYPSVIPGRSLGAPPPFIISSTSKSKRWKSRTTVCIASCFGLVGGGRLKGKVP